MIFEDIEFEVEHPLYLARISQVPTNEKALVILPDKSTVSYPTFAVQVRYIPRYETAPAFGTAYRVLYETSIIVGYGFTDEDLDVLTEKAEHLAETKADPTEWTE